jgi:hypothetical protein
LYVTDRGQQQPLAEQVGSPYDVRYRMQAIGVCEDSAKKKDAHPACKSRTT